MALRNGDEHFTMFAFTENGDVKNRRLHRLEFQDRTGKVHILEGKELPNFIMASTGQGQKGCHMATILLKPESATPLIPILGFSLWPTRRDVLCGLAGMIAFMFVLHWVRVADADSTPRANALPPYSPGVTNNWLPLDPSGPGGSRRSPSSLWR